MDNKIIKYLLEKNEISYLDYHFAKFATGLSGKEDDEILLAAALVSSKTREGHICIKLDEYENKCLIPDDDKSRCPELGVWLSKIRNCEIVGKPGEFKPLILDEKNRLYLYRYWAYEDRIAKHIKQFVNESSLENGVEEISERLKILFPSPKAAKSPDLQKFAAYTAKIKKLTIISGGPGTGKTTTVAKILALLIEQAIGYRVQGLKPEGRGLESRAKKKSKAIDPDELQFDFGIGEEDVEVKVKAEVERKNEERAIKIMLAAPTGKAAARLQESIKNFKIKAKNDGLDIRDEVLNLIPEEASTIHRLLGSIPNSPYFRHNKKNPLKLDVLVVDEASMIDVPLMAKLLEALPEHSKLIILGDKDQLSSVEAGKFMGDVCMSALKSNYSSAFFKAFKSITGMGPMNVHMSQDGYSLRECFIHLTESYRFGSNSGIGELSRLVNNGNSKEASKLLFSGKFSDISMKDISNETELEKELRETVTKHYKNYIEAARVYEKNPDDVNLKNVFRYFDQFRVLCAMREGPFGINRINSVIESILRDAKMIGFKSDWYMGMPIMITQNSYGVSLFNGDIGIVLPNSESDKKLKAFFPSADGRYKKFHQLRLPEYEKVYAMTVHKSQGSEFDHVVLILPDKQNPVLTRELLYTGITRAKNKAAIWSSAKVFEDTIEANIKRSSGLYDALCIN